ncbi:MAG: hypothetical protein P1V35_13225, partial [Planctomycetota bacterium]|nr:hypothetical protein [Planctomycetota bacterium]
SIGLPYSDGLLCLLDVPANRITRYDMAGTSKNSLGMLGSNGDLQNLVVTDGASGFGFDVAFGINLGGVAKTIMAGDTLSFQCWYRGTTTGIGHSNIPTAAMVSFRQQASKVVNQDVGDWALFEARSSTSITSWE